MCLFEKAHNKARAASKTIEKLVRLRKEQAQSDGKNLPEGVDQMFLSKIDYDSLTAPFLYRLGDTLASYIEYNTDTFNNLKPIEYDEDSDEEEVVDEGGEDQEKEDVAAAIQASLGEAKPLDTIEEEKEVKPQDDDEQQINTIGAAIKAPTENENGEGAANDQEELI
jgi:hypothetical protein